MYVCMYVCNVMYKYRLAPHVVRVVVSGDFRKRAWTVLQH
jgi:hypothetical protein